MTITADEALDLVSRAAMPLAAKLTPLEDALGLVLAEEVAADRDYPPFPRSLMDGYAVRLADAGKTVPVIGELPAGSIWENTIVDGSCLAILTGAACPDGTEAVVPKEQTRRQGSEVSLPTPLLPNQNIARLGSECGQGDCVLAAGMRVTPLAVGVLASFGKHLVRVIPRPRLGIITTGGELAGEGMALQPGQIRDSNGPMLAAMAQAVGISSPRCLHAGDDLSELRQALEKLADMDIVVLTGGVSVGTYDLVPPVLVDIGAEVVFHGVKQKPGKPILFARTDRQIFFGLPGNPLAGHLGFHRYVSAAIRKMSGRDALQYCFHGELACPVESKGGRTHFMLGRAELAIDSYARWRIAPLSAASSADIFRTCDANCYIELPSLDRTLQVGETYPFTWLADHDRNE